MYLCVAAAVFRSCSVSLRWTAERVYSEWFACAARSVCVSVRRPAASCRCGLILMSVWSQDNGNGITAISPTERCASVGFVRVQP